MTQKKSELPGLTSIADELRRRSSVGRMPISDATDVSCATTSESEPSCDTDASVRSPCFVAVVPCTAPAFAPAADGAFGEAGVAAGVLVPDALGVVCTLVPRSSCRLYSMPLISAKCL